jgi:hypothetical protein
MVCFQTKNPNLGKFWRALRLENVYIFYGHLEYFKDVWAIVCPFGTFCVDLVHFLVSRTNKNLATLHNRVEIS